MDINQMNDLLLVQGDDVLQLSVTRRGSFSKVMGKSSKVNLPEVYIPSLFRNEMGDDVGIFMKDSSFFYVWVASAVPIFTNWTLDNKGILTPKFNVQENGVSDFDSTVNWKPPGQMFYVLQPTYNSTHKYWTVAQLYAFIFWKNQTYKPPLPNCYPDGRLCWGGDQPKKSETPTAVDLMSWTVKNISSARWNSDLYTEEISNYMKFKADPDNQDEWVQINPNKHSMQPLSNKTLTALTKLL